MSNRLEAPGSAGLNAVQRYAPQQVCRHLPRQGLPRSVQACVLGQRGYIEVECDTALPDKAPAELIAVARRRHEN